MSECFDEMARRINSVLPDGPRIAVLGSTRFYHEDSDWICSEIGHLLATLPDLTLVTGGVSGVGEAVSRSFFQSRRQIFQDPRVYHILPQQSLTRDYGTTLFAGADMSERREVLGRISKLYLIIEGGPGTDHEADVAMRHGAVLLPLGRTGGSAAKLLEALPRPVEVEPQWWTLFGDTTARFPATADAVLRSVHACIESVK